MSKARKPVREPAVAGQFYPADPETLRTTVRDLLGGAEAVSIHGEVFGLVVPHAGYPFSGAVAAAAYQTVRHRPFDAVVVICPSHRERFQGASIFRRGSYGTPLGPVGVAEDLAAEILLETPDAFASEAGHRVASASRFDIGGLRGEHAIEVQLPFLQEIIPDLRIVPIVLSDADFTLCARLGSSIARASQGRSVLVVASSDLYHGESYEACCRADEETLQGIRAFNPEAFARDLERRTCQACGGAAITTAMVSAREMGAERTTIVARENSGDVTGRREGYVVGYGAVVFHGSRAEPPPVRDLPPDLPPDLRERLLRLAREAIGAALGRGPAPAAGARPPPLCESRGVFVTLTEGGNLRGCIGQVRPGQPLAQAVQQLAVSAATRDPRFPPVSPDDLPQIRIEISILSPPRRMVRPEDLLVGTHGLIIRRPGGLGLLLPQVAVEHGWDRRTFLCQTCVKAGLPDDAWLSAEAEVSTFTTERFGED